MRLRRLVLAACVTAVAVAPGVAAAAAAAATRCAGLPPHGAFPVVDAANAVAPEPEAYLIADLLRFQQSDDVAIVAATVPSLGGDDVSSYAHRLFGCWGVGDAQSDNGVLILVAMREHKVRIELGTGLVGRVDQEDLDTAIGAMAAPLRAGDVGLALRTAAERVATATGGTLPDTADQVRSGRGIGDTSVPVSIGDDEIPRFQPDSPDFEDPFRNVERTASWLFVAVPVFIVVVFVVVIVGAIARGASGVAGAGSAWRGGFPVSLGQRAFMGPSMYAGGRWSDPTSWMRPEDPPTLASGSTSAAHVAPSEPSGTPSTPGGGSSFGGGSGSGGGASGSW